MLVLDGITAACRHVVRVDDLLPRTALRSPYSSCQGRFTRRVHGTEQALSNVAMDCKFGMPTIMWQSFQK